MMVAADDFAHGNVIAENVEHWSNGLVSRIVLENFDLGPNAKLDSVLSVCNLNDKKQIGHKFVCVIKIENQSFEKQAVRLLLISDFQTI